MRDLRDALRSDNPPEHHAERLDRFVHAEWRLLVVVPALLLGVGGLLDALGLIG